MDISAQKYKLTSLSAVNVVIGKNGCGKSTLLKAVEQSLIVANSGWGKTRYITPERGGVLVHEPNVEQNMNQNIEWMPNVRRANQLAQFRQQTMAQYRKLELSVLREIEEAVQRQGQAPPSFNKNLEAINALLDNVEIRRHAELSTFEIYARSSGDLVKPSDISSGEAELISLAIECLAFTRELEDGKGNLLCLDEPDVHLHPDLQGRFVKFVKSLMSDKPFTVLIATHSTAMLGELSDYEKARVALMRAGDVELRFQRIDETYRDILPVFGAHPLSNMFNSAPILLVEGEDDVRIWQQAVRSSIGKLKVYPVPAGSLGQLTKYEKRAKEIIEAVYDEAVGYSIRDGDGKSEELTDDPPIVRMRLSCYAAENLILSDEVLAAAGVSWDQAKVAIQDWLTKNEGDTRFQLMKEFEASGFDRKLFNVKDLRMLLVGSVLQSNKPWEVLVGKVIGSLDGADYKTVEDGSLASFLGEKVCRDLLGAGNEGAP